MTKESKPVVQQITDILDITHRDILKIHNLIECVTGKEVKKRQLKELKKYGKVYTAGIGVYTIINIRLNDEEE